MSDKDECWIVPGDWIIRSVPEKADYEDSYEFLARGPRAHRCEDDTFTDHAVFVIDITKSHMTIFEPMAGRPFIIQLSKFEGTWHMATARQVETTWAMASGLREKSNTFMIEVEKKQYPYRVRTPLPPMTKKDFIILDRDHESVKSRKRQP